MFDHNIPILVVDDMMTMRKIVINVCRQLGFTKFVEAGDGAAAWEIVNGGASNIGLIISDWNMPNSTGIDLLKRVRSDSRFKDLPFVLVTAETEKHQVAEAIAAGVSHYVTKPFSADTLGQRLTAVFAKKAA